MNEEEKGKKGRGLNRIRVRGTGYGGVIICTWYISRSVIGQFVTK